MGMDLVRQDSWLTTRADAKMLRVGMDARFHYATMMTLAGLEPAIFGSEDQRLIH